MQSWAWALRVFWPQAFVCEQQMLTLDRLLTEKKHQTTTLQRIVSTRCFTCPFVKYKQCITINPRINAVSFIYVNECQ